jgi:hypothetical protein
MERMLSYSEVLDLERLLNTLDLLLVSLDLLLNHMLDLKEESLKELEEEEDQEVIEHKISIKFHKLLI